jgi:hypothetical protein
LLVAGFIIALSANIFSVNGKSKNLDNHIEIALEAAKRLNPSILGLIGGTLRGDPLSAVGGEERLFREINNILFDWYAPIQLSPVLSISKEIGWLVLRKNISQNFSL